MAWCFICAERRDDFLLLTKWQLSTQTCRYDPSVRNRRKAAAQFGNLLARSRPLNRAHIPRKSVTKAL